MYQLSGNWACGDSEFPTYRTRRTHLRTRRDPGFEPLRIVPHGEHESQELLPGFVSGMESFQDNAPWREMNTSGQGIEFLVKGRGGRFHHHGRLLVGLFVPLLD